MMKKFSYALLRVVFCVCLSLVALSVVKAEAATLGELQQKFPNGAYWNHVAGNGHYYSNYSDVGSCNNPDGYSWSPCYSHNADAPYGYYDCNSFNGGIQCCGFARKLAFDAYGSYATNWTNYTYDAANNYMWNSLKPGDVLHYEGGNAGAGTGHWVFVTAVNGNAITVGECNLYNAPCQIRWGNVIYKGDISAVRVCVAPYELPVIRQDAIDYIEKCTKYPTYGTIRVTKNGANINDRPCSKETDSKIVTLIDAAIGAEYTVTAVYKNTENNYWFEVMTDRGQPGYIFSGNCNYQPKYDDVVCNGSVPASVAMDGKLTLSGSITAPSTKIQKATVTLYKENGKEYASLTKKAVDGAIDLSGFSFQLSASKQMKLTCKVVVNVAHYNITTQKYPTGSTKTYDLGTVELTCVNHAYGEWTLTKDYTCTVDGEWTRSCTICKQKETQPAVAPGHNWTVINASGVTCTNPGYTNYSCLTCGERKSDVGQVTWSDWSAEYPQTSLDRIETKKQYRYRDLVGGEEVSQRDYVDYVKNWPGGFDWNNSHYTTYAQTPKTEYETDTERLVIESDEVVGYIYWHWCRGRYLEKPYNSAISDGYTSTFWCFHAYYSTNYIAYDGSANAWNASNYSCCQDTYWYFQLPVYRQTYRVETKNTGSGQWGDWSQWSDNAVTASGSREVQTRNVYRYMDGGLAEHKWDTPVRTKEPTKTSEGELTYTCTVCGNKMIEILPKLQLRECSHDNTKRYEKVDPTCTTAGYSGDLICMTCGELVEKGEKMAALGHSWKAATCTAPKTCKTCGETSGKELGHSWKAATCTASKTCKTCGTTTGEPLGHDWKAANCTAPKTCKTCDTTKGKPAGHVYDNNVDGTCNRCKVHREEVESREVVHMFRMYNPNTGEHFYTGSTEERDNLIVAGWQYEGVGFTFPANTGAPVYRLFQPSTGEHLYTMSEAEKDKLMAQGWNYEGIAFNSAYDTEAVQHRLHNPNAIVGAYHFTFSEEEMQNLINAGWEYQGIGWYSCWK